MGEVLGEQRREQWHKWVGHLGLEPGPDAVQEVERRWKGDTKMGSWARQRLESRIQGNIRGHYRVVTGVSLHRKLGGPGREGTEVSKQAGNTGCLRTQQGWDLPGATVLKRLGDVWWMQRELWEEWRLSTRTRVWVKETGQSGYSKESG